MPAPLLISLPHGLNASGVTSWAVRLANAMAQPSPVARLSEPRPSPTTRPIALILHAEPDGQRPIDFAIDPRIDLFDARDLPPLDSCNGDLSPYLPLYRLALGVLAAQSPGLPVVCSPNLLGDSYGIIAELSRQMPGLVRTFAVHHSDLRYNDLVCAHYAHTINAFVGVSERITTRLQRMFPTRGPDIFGIPYGVELPERLRLREPMTVARFSEPGAELVARFSEPGAELVARFSEPGAELVARFSEPGAERPLRLLYAGRMDHEQKRILALVAMADELCCRGIAHELLLLGDGPAAAELDALSAHRPTIRRFASTTPAGVAEALDAADCFVLPSRYEGLSIALLEALARGCIPVLTPSRSGTGQLVRDSETGFLAHADPEADAKQAGLAMAEAVERVARHTETQLHEIRERGWSLVRACYSVELCAQRYGALIDRIAQQPPRPWPTHRPTAFTGNGSGGSGSVPAEAAKRMGKVLDGLTGCRVAIFGTGRHTLELRETIVRTPTTIAAFLDEDEARHGQALWGLPIVAPEQAVAMGITDIVISSWLHQEAMMARCAPLESAGVRVHTLYAGSRVCAMPG